MHKYKFINILDTTLRDGSYTIGYQFNYYDTELIVKGLEKGGLKLIEVGHGLGLGAYKINQSIKITSDLEYMKACNSSLTKSEFGFFFIPGIGSIDDIKLLSDNGGSFIG